MTDKGYKTCGLDLQWHTAQPLANIGIINLPFAPYGWNLRGSSKRDKSQKEKKILSELPHTFYIRNKNQEMATIEGKQTLRLEPRTEVSRELCVWEMEGRCVVSGRDPRNHEERR